MSASQVRVGQGILKPAGELKGILLEVEYLPVLVPEHGSALVKVNPRRYQLC